MSRVQTLTLNVNGATHKVSADADAPLLYLLRNDLALNGPKFGCGLGECGACTVLLDGMPTRSCVTTAKVALGREITTLEGLGSRAALHPVQQAFIEEQAAQCGYCLNGMIMTAKALLDRDPHPGDETIRRELSRNLCRCGTHVEIVRAVQRAAQLLAEQASRERGARV
ncbi:(2Fe-2S)-binding protein [Paraburkholderia xenovorans]|uniref:(2Fe-2S)-binding protein n=1 Tax=Paraburkholderia xenovorans TaxID=36873 RepID=UPI0038B9D648